MIALAEWGDLTQIATASLSAKSGEPVATAIGAWLALAAVAGLAATFGQQLVRRVPLHKVNYVGAAIFADATKKFILQAEVTYNGTTVVTIKNLNTDIAYTVETAAPGGATFVWAQTQAPGGTKIPFGRFLVGDGTGENCKVVTGATVVGDIIGVSAANYQTQQASPTIDPTIEDGYEPGREVSVYGVGPIDVLTEQAVTPADTVFVRIVASGNNTKLGIVRKDADGGNAITATTIARFTDSAAAGETARIKLHIPLPKP